MSQPNTSTSGTSTQTRPASPSALTPKPLVSSQSTTSLASCFQGGISRESSNEPGLFTAGSQVGVEDPSSKSNLPPTGLGAFHRYFGLTLKGASAPGSLKPSDSLTSLPLPLARDTTLPLSSESPPGDRTPLSSCSPQRVSSLDKGTPPPIPSPSPTHLPVPCQFTAQLQNLSSFVTTVPPQRSTPSPSQHANFTSSSIVPEESQSPRRRSASQLSLVTTDGTLSSSPKSSTPRSSSPHSYSNPSLSPPCAPPSPVVQRKESRGEPTAATAIPPENSIPSVHSVTETSPLPAISSETKSAQVVSSQVAPIQKNQVINRSTTWMWISFQLEGWFNPRKIVADIMNVIFKALRYAGKGFKIGMYGGSMACPGVGTAKGALGGAALGLATGLITGASLLALKPAMSGIADYKKDQNLEYNSLLFQEICKKNKKLAKSAQYQPVLTRARNFLYWLLDSVFSVVDLILTEAYEALIEPVYCPMFGVTLPPPEPETPDPTWKEEADQLDTMLSNSGDKTLNYIFHGEARLKGNADELDSRHEAAVMNEVFQECVVANDSHLNKMLAQHFKAVLVEKAKEGVPQDREELEKSSPIKKFTETFIKLEKATFIKEFTGTFTKRMGRNTCPSAISSFTYNTVEIDGLPSLATTEVCAFGATSGAIIGENNDSLETSKGPAKSVLHKIHKFLTQKSTGAVVLLLGLFLEVLSWLPKVNFFTEWLRKKFALPSPISFLLKTITQAFRNVGLFNADLKKREKVDGFFAANPTLNLADLTADHAIIWRRLGRVIRHDITENIPKALKTLSELRVNFEEEVVEAKKQELKTKFADVFEEILNYLYYFHLYYRCYNRGTFISKEEFIEDYLTNLMSLDVDPIKPSASVKPSASSQFDSSEIG